MLNLLLAAVIREDVCSWFLAPFIGLLKHNAISSAVKVVAGSITPKFLIEIDCVTSTPVAVVKAGLMRAISLSDALLIRLRHLMS